MNKRDPRRISEAAVLKAVKALLEARGFRVFRRNTGAFRGEYRSKRTGKVSQRFVRFSEPGMADLWGWAKRDQQFWNKVQPNEFIRAGDHIECEVKAPGEKLSLVQATWLAQAEKEGCLVLWADSVEMCEAKLKEWGL